MVTIALYLIVKCVFCLRAAIQTKYYAAHNWVQFSKGKKRVQDTNLSYDEAKRACAYFNANRTPAQKKKGTMMEFESQ